MRAVSKERQWIFTEKADSLIHLSTALWSFQILDEQLCGFTVLFICLHRVTCRQHEYNKRRRSAINSKYT